MPGCLQVLGSSVQFVTSGTCDLLALTPSEYDQFLAFMDASTMTPQEILYVYSWGMGAVLLPFSIALIVKVLVKTVKLT